MRFLLKICVLSIIIECTINDQVCTPSNRNVGKCQDWKNMSLLVADLVGRSNIKNDKVETKSNILTLLIRAASGVIGRGTDALKTVIVNGLVILTHLILTVSKNRVTKKGAAQQSKFISDSHPIDWIMNNSYIKSMVDDAIDETLPDKLVKMASGMPCVQLLMCRFSPIIHEMQRWVKSRHVIRRPYKSFLSWTLFDWQRVKSSIVYCSELHNECVKFNKYHTPVEVRA